MLHKFPHLAGPKTLKLRIIFGLIGALALLLAVQGFINPQSTAFAATAPTLGTAGNFAVLAGTALTNTGPSVIGGGNMGVSPQNSVTGFPPGILNPPGSIQVGNAVALQAQNDSTTAYNSLAGQPCDTNLSGQDLGGLTLTTGVYCFSTAAQLTGALTLDAQGDPNAVFIFQIGSTLTTASNSSVLLINGASPCTVFWQVGSSATLGTTTSFVGNIIALTSITLTTGASLSGRVLARNGAVTLDTNTITQLSCVLVTPTPTATAIPTATSTPAPTATIAPTATPAPTATRRPTSGPLPTHTPVPTSVPGTFPPVTPAAGNVTPTPDLNGTPLPAGQPGNTAPAAGSPTPGPDSNGTPGPDANGTPSPAGVEVPVPTPDTTPHPNGTPTPRPGLPPLPNTGPDSAPAETFPQTGFSLSGSLLSYWHINGGLPIFGYPIDSERESSGDIYQLFERNRLELHPENIAPYNILLGRLGAEVLAKNGVDWTTLPKVESAPADCLYFAQTGHSLCGAFLAYWQSHGLAFDGTLAGPKTFAEAVALFGLPLSEPRLETNSSGDTVLTQWFERARFEYHSDLPTQYQVLLGRLGAELNVQLPRSNRI